MQGQCHPTAIIFEHISFKLILVHCIIPYQILWKTLSNKNNAFFILHTCLYFVFSSNISISKCKANATQPQSPYNGFLNSHDIHSYRLMPCFENVCFTVYDYHFPHYKNITNAFVHKKAAFLVNCILIR